MNVVSLYTIFIPNMYVNNLSEVTPRIKKKNFTKIVLEKYISTIYRI